MSWKELKTMRESKNLTQDTVATQIGVTGTCISTWEKHAPRWANWVKGICKCFNCSPNELFGYVDDKGDIKDEQTVVKQEPMFTDQEMTLIQASLVKNLNDMRHQLVRLTPISYDYVDHVNMLAALVDKIDNFDRD